MTLDQFSLSLIMALIAKYSFIFTPLGGFLTASVLTIAFVQIMDIKMKKKGKQ